MKINKKFRKVYFFVLLIALLLSISSLVFAVKQSNLSYSSSGSLSNLSYDNLGRLKNVSIAGGRDLFYSYDSRFYGVLDNVSSGLVNSSFVYDDELRVVKESVFVDGLRFDKSYFYDSQDRVVRNNIDPGVDPSFVYSAQGIKKIPGFVSGVGFTGFGQDKNISFSNGLKTNYSYSIDNLRLKNIKTGSLQNISYAYDRAGNVLSINGSSKHNMSYDSLDRLISVKIGSDNYEYSYSPTGNIMRIQKNNASKRFVYDKLAHAPSMVLENSFGSDVYKFSDLDSGNRNRTFEIILVNDKNSSVISNFTINFGDGKSFTSSNLNLSTSIMAFVENNYSRGRSYKVNLTVRSSNNVDRQNLNLVLGTKIVNLSVKNNTATTWRLLINNTLDEKARNVRWSCTGNIISNLFNLSNWIQGNLSYQYSSFGNKLFSCNATSFDGNQSKSLEFKVKGLEVEDYEQLSSNNSVRLYEFKARNYFRNNLSTNISVETGDAKFSQINTINSNTFVLVLSEVNYSTDGSKNFTVNLSSGSSDKFVQPVLIEGAQVRNYQRINLTNSNKLLMFDLVNNWRNGIVNWSVNIPSINNRSSLGYNQTLMVFIESNYTNQTQERIVVDVKRSNYKTNITDQFRIRPLQIQSLTVLNEGRNTTTEFIIKNNLGYDKNFNLRYDTGIQNITPSVITLNNSIFVFIESNYSSSQIYKTNLKINSTHFNDTQSGVVRT